MLHSRFLNVREQSALSAHAALLGEKQPCVICMLYTHNIIFRSAAPGRASVSFARTVLPTKTLGTNGRPSQKKGDERGRRRVPPHPHRTQSAFMKSIITYTWQRVHMHGTKRAHQCLDPTPPHRTSHRTSPPSTNSHARSPDMEQHGSLDGDPCPIYARQASNRYLITCTRLFRSVPGGAVDCRHLHLRIE